MKLTSEQVRNLNMALNEATITKIDFLQQGNDVKIHFVGVSVSDEEDVSNNSSILEILSISRIVASFISPFSNQIKTPVKLSINELQMAVKDFGPFSIYDNDFFNCNEENFFKWKKTLSIDYKDQSKKAENTITLAHIVGDRTIYIKIWFDDIKIYSPSTKEISLEKFKKNAENAWNNLQKKDLRYKDKFKIYPID